MRGYFQPSAGPPFSRGGFQSLAVGGGGGATPYTYYRLYILENNGDDQVGIGEVELYETVGGASVSANSGTASASSDDGGTGTADKAFDGAAASGVQADSWRSAPRASFAPPEWVRKQFDTAFSIAQFGVVNWTTDFSADDRAPKTAILQGSDNGSTWATVGAFEQETGWTFAERRKWTVTSPVRYRLSVTANNGDGTYVGLSKIELRESVGGADVNPRAGISSTGGSEVSGDEPFYAFDGTTDNFRAFVSDGWPITVEKFYNVGFDVAQYAIRNFDGVNAATRAPKDWTLQRSYDGETWETLHTVTGETGWSTGETRVFTL